LWSEGEKFMGWFPTLGLGWEGGGEKKHGGGFLLFDKECILLFSDLYQWSCGTNKTGRNEAAGGFDAWVA
jgi:hypothetical protein